MNIRTLISSFCLSFCAVCLFSDAVLAQENNKPQVRRTSTFRGDSYAYKLTDQDFVNTPSWNGQDETTEPPLSMSRALKIARENLPRFVKNVESWKMRMIMLQSIGEDKWYYRVHFFCSGAVCREIEDRNFTAIVKMDGTIIEPKKVTIEN